MESTMPQRDAPDFERPAPRTDPTNPYAQESVGLNEAARWANERSVDEPGLTERDRDERAQALGSRARARQFS
jgi:hypothetical protein